MAPATEQPLTRPTTSNYGWVVTFGGFTMHLALGTIYCWGNMTTYVTSYFRKYTPSVTYHESLLVFALAIIGQAMTMLIGGLSYQKLGPRISALIGCTMVAASMAISSLMTTLVPFAMLEGVVFGAGVGIAYVSPMVCGGKWMPQRKGLVNGIVTAGFGLGAFLFDFVITHMMNPDNITPCAYNNATCKYGDPNDLKARYFDPDGAVVKSVPHGLLILGGCYVGLGVLGASVLVDPPLKPDNANPREIEKLLLPRDSTMSIQSTHVGTKAKAIGPMQLVCLREGWLLWTMFICTSSSGLFLLGSYKTHAQSLSFGKDDRFLSLIGSLMSVSNFLGRVTQGFLADKLGVIRMLQIMPVVLAILVATLPAISKSKNAFAAWCCLIIFCYGGNFSLYPTATTQLFGAEKSGANYGIVFTGVGIAGVVSSLLMSKLETAFHGFEYLAYFMAAVTLCGSLLTLLIRNPKRVVP